MTPSVVWLAFPAFGLLIWSLIPPGTTQVVKQTSAPIIRQALNECAGRSQPREGIFRWYGRAWGEDIAKFTIATASGSNYFVKLEDMSGRPARAYFVRGGSTISNLVPLGSFTLKYASGSLWCGEAELFGPDTTTKQADKILDFEQHVTEDSTSVTTHTSDITVELILQPGGNLRTHPIPMSKF